MSDNEAAPPAETRETDTDTLYRVGEWASIKALVADRDEMTVYLKVEAALAELERLQPLAADAPRDHKRSAHE